MKTINEHMNEPDENPETLWTIDDVATFLKVKPSVIRYWLRCLSFPHIRLGKQIRFDPEDVKTWIDDHKNHNAHTEEELKRII